METKKPCSTCGSVDRQPCGNCRVCSRISRRKYHASHPDVQRAKMRRYEAQNREKKNARLAVRKAIKAGKLSRSLVCQICWVVCKTEAHHPDYTRRFDVVWLCGNCHRFIHGRQAKS